MFNFLLKGTFIRKVLNILCYFFSFFNKFIPKNKNQYLFFNSKEVYINNYSYIKYLVESEQTKGKKIYYSIPKLSDETVKNSDVIHITSALKTLLIFLTSEYVFYDTGNIRIKPSSKQFIINFWHGSPLKRIGHSAKEVPKDLKKNSINKFSKIIIASSFFENIYVKSFNIDRSQIVIAGQPRLDRLLMPNKDARFFVDDYKHTVMWMTTYRISYDGRLHHTENNNWSETELPILTKFEDFFQLNSILQELEINLIIKIHHGSVFNENKTVNNLSNILLIQDKDIIKQNVELYDILGYCDSLITDYSSVFFDYLLLDKKIGFIIDDMNSYEKNNGFNFENPLNLMPGKKIKTKEDLIDFFRIVNLDKDEFKNERKKINELTNANKDYGNCFQIDKLLERKNYE